MMETLIERLDHSMSVVCDLIRSGKCLETKGYIESENLNFLYELVLQIDEKSSAIELNKAIEAISLPSKERFEYYENKGHNMFYQQSFDFLSEYEIAELHRLKLLLPSYLEVQHQAREKILQRSLERKRLMHIKNADRFKAPVD